MGNARVNFRANGAAIANIEDHHYYPFGLKMEGIGSSTVTNKYTYNDKELNEDFGLNWHDYGARWYDAALGVTNHQKCTTSLHQKCTTGKS